MFRRRNRLAALLAGFAVMLQALWPLLSHARPQDAPLLAPVCTVDGITHYLDLKPGKTPLDERASLHGEHCKLCVFGGDKDVVVLSSNELVPLVQDLNSALSLPAAEFIEPHHLVSARPRAPPAFS